MAELFIACGITFHALIVHGDTKSCNNLVQFIGFHVLGHGCL